MRVLIVDDSRSMRMIVRRALRQAGYGNAEVVEAEHGAEALKVLQSTPADVIISDWNMPVMGGFELLTELNARGSKVPFGFVTSEATAEVRAQASGAGARFFILKPFAPESFEDALNAIFKGASREVFQVRVAQGLERGEGLILPSTQSVADCLTGLLGKPVTGLDWKTGPEPGVPTATALYHGGAALDFVCVCDLAFAGYTSGALALMADAQVKKAVEMKKLPENLVEMTREVFNVMARLFVAEGHQPKLRSVIYSPAPLPPEATALIKAPGATSYMVVNVPGYGKGRLSAFARK